MGKSLIVLGLALAALGVLVSVGLPFGRLPGDILIKRGHTTFFFPITTGIVVSLLLSVVFGLLRR